MTFDDIKYDDEDVFPVRWVVVWEILTETLQKMRINQDSWMKQGSDSAI